MIARALPVAAAVMTVAACGSALEETPRQARAPESEGSCVSAAGETAEGVDRTDPAYPVAMGPDGPVIGVKRELDDGTAIFISDSGVCSVAETAPGTWAATGVVVDEQDRPVADAHVSYEALEPRGLDVRIATRTDEDGAFALVNVPIVGERSCYRQRIVAEGFRPFVLVEVFWPETYGQSVTLSRESYDMEGGATDRRGCHP